MRSKQVLMMCNALQFSTNYGGSKVLFFRRVSERPLGIIKHLLNIKQTLSVRHAAGVMKL